MLHSLSQACIMSCMMYSMKPIWLFGMLQVARSNMGITMGRCRCFSSSVCMKYSSAMRRAHSMQYCIGLAGLLTSATLISMRRMSIEVSSSDCASYTIER